MPTHFISRHFVAIILFVFQLIFGLVYADDFGVSWDEPYFYDYAESVGTAYTTEVFQKNFDFEQIYGKSAEDHKYYGPAYLLLAKPLAGSMANFFNLGYFDSWHAANFIFFNLGLFFFYLTLLYWIDPLPAGFTTALIAWQPLLFGHSFINPKDVPFLVFCVLTNYFGISLLRANNKFRIINLVLFGTFLGLSSSIRVIGPLFGVFFLIGSILKKNKTTLFSFLLSGLIAIIVMVMSWPFLWSDPINNLLVVLKHMSNNPTELAVLFEGVVFRANAMPISYIPKMILFTLTEPVIPLAFFGSLLILLNPNYRKFLLELLPSVLILVFILIYIFISRPAVYDGFRHFLFITPTIFILVSFSFNSFFKLFSKNKKTAFILGLLILLPGFTGILRNHPYEYAYYNQLTGGINGAYRTYETDYWLTCYSEVIEWFEDEHPGETLFVQRELPLALVSGTGKIVMEPLPQFSSPVTTGTYLFHTRANLDLRSEYRGLKTIQVFGVDKAEFCLIKSAP